MEDKLVGMPSDVWKATYSAPAEWDNVGVATFFSFAKPFSVSLIGGYRSTIQPGPLLAAALLPTGHLGFLSNQQAPNGTDQPLLKFMHWPNGASWADMTTDKADSQFFDTETLQWSAGLMVAQLRMTMPDLECEE